MKKNLLQLLGFILIAGPLTANAFQEGHYTYTVTNGQAMITRFDQAYSGALSITNTLGGYPVTSIGQWAFSHCASLTAVTIPDSVTYIGANAFSPCTSLTVTNYPASFHRIVGP